MTPLLREPVRDTEVAEQAAALAACSRRLHAQGLLAGAEGNCSVRLRDGTLLVTPSGADKASLTAPQVLRRHADGTEYHNGGTATVTSDTSSGDSPPRPSSELQMHLGIYGSRADVMAVVHAHPPVATGFATAGRTIPADVLPEVPVVLGPVALVPYGRPGTAALFHALFPFVADHDVFLLCNHGVTAVGRSLTEALTRLESVEQAARIVLVAELLGGPRVLPAEEAQALASLWRRPVASTYSAQHSTDALS